MICARMYHHHIAIVLRNEIWCTRKDSNYEKCLIKLAYMGGVVYLDMATGPSAFLKPLTDSTSIMQNIPLNLSAKPNRKHNRCKSPTEETPRKKRHTRHHARSSMHLRSSGVLLYTNALKNKPRKPKVCDGKNPKGESGG